jgi:hypothetical protein
VLNPTLTAATISATLREVGLDVAPAQVRVEKRDDRWLAWLPGERLAWFPANAKGRARLDVERRVLRLLAERCSFGAPHVLFESEEGWDVRAAVPGVCDPGALYRRTLTDVALARRLGATIGAILVEQHTRIAHADVAGRRLLGDIDRVLDAYDSVTRVLVHGDLGLHNVAVDPETTEVRGRG